MTSAKQQRRALGTTVQLLGGPYHQHTYTYPQPLPDILVMCDTTTNRFIYHDYHRDGDTTTYRYR